MPIQLYFKVRCETLLSEQLCISGSVKELGYWNPQQSFQLQTNNEIYPLWTGNIRLEAEENSLVEFKAIKMGRNVIWEDIDNRVIQLRYQEQTILFSFNSSFIKLIRITSFVSLSDDEFEDECLSNKKNQEDPCSITDHDDCSETDEEHDVFFLLDSQKIKCVYIYNEENMAILNQ